MATPVFSQSQDKIDRLEKIENNSKDTFKLIIRDKAILVEQDDGEMRISVGKKAYIKKSKTFKGHLGGVGFGFNGFLTDYWSSSLNPGEEYFDINTTKSIAWNFFLPDVSLKITRNIGLVSTLGLTLNNYHFDNNNSIIKDNYGVIGPLYPAPGVNYKKSKLNAGYATIPVVLEFQIPVNGSSRKNVYVSGGVIGAVKLWSKTKVVWHDNGGKHKKKEKDDFSLNVLRWGATARAGYRDFQVYGTTYFTQMFEKGKGPELYPFEVGIALSF